MEYIKQSMNDIWAAAGDVVMPDEVKIAEGWLVEVPPRQYWNWMQNRTDVNLAYIFQRGVPEWDISVEYLANKSFVVYNGIVYKCILTGIGKNPESQPTYWARAFRDWSAIGQAVDNLTPAADRFVYYTGANTAALATVTSFARSILDDTSAADVRTTIGAQASDATLTALAGLATGANQLPYFTGTDTAAQTPITSFGRSLIDDADASEARTTLGLASGATTTVGTIATQNANAVSITGGSITGITDLAITDGGTGASTAAGARSNLGLGNAATATVQTNGMDTTAGRLMAVGAFGLGGLVDLRGTEFETGTPQALYGKGAVTGFANGGPDGLAIPWITGNNIFGVLSGFGHWPDSSGGAGAAWREFRTSGGRVYHQDHAGGAWGAWRELFHTGNQLSLGTTPAEAQAALELVKGTSPGNVLVAGEGLVGRHTVECFAFSDAGNITGVTIYTNIQAVAGILPNLIIRGALNGYTEPFEARLSWYFYDEAVYLPNVLITATGGVSGVRFYLRPENGKIVIRIDFGGNVYIPRLTFDALQIPGVYNFDPSMLRGWSAVTSNASGSGEVEALRARTYHSRNILGTVSQSGGVPTGAIIERGSNANGEYVRFADGTQICVMPEISATTSSSSGLSVLVGSRTFPAPFISQPSLSDYVVGGGSDSTKTGYLNLTAGGVAQYVAPLAAIAYAKPVSVGLTAIGRWY